MLNITGEKLPEKKTWYFVIILLADHLALDVGGGGGE